MAAIGIALHVGIANPGFAQIFELAIFPHPGKSEAVIDVRDFVQRRARVLRHQEQPLSILESYNGTPLGNALARILGLVLHLVIWRNEEPDRRSSTLATPS